MTEEESLEMTEEELLEMTEEEQSLEMTEGRAVAKMTM